jgi:predicted phosphodiesterase
MTQWVFAIEVDCATLWLSPGNRSGVGLRVRIAVLSDIHGNAQALKQTLDSARKLEADHLIVLGDIVGYYYDAKDVVRQLRSWPLSAIAGNHEALLAAVCSDEEAALRYRAKYGSSLDVARASLSDQELAWLLALPKSLIVRLGGLTLELHHGTPNDPNGYIYPDAKSETIERCIRPGRFLLLGHTHYSMIVVRPEGIILNPGSVGQARDLGGFASWCLLNTVTGAVTFQRTPYDYEAIASQVKCYDPELKYLTNVLFRGWTAPARRSYDL